MTVKLEGKDREAKAGPHPPLLPDVGVIALVPDNWVEYWESRHHVLSRLARYFNVVWVNPAPEWRDLQVLSAPSAQDQNNFHHPATGNFVIYKPKKWLPKMYRPNFLASFTEEKRLLQARKILQKLGSRKFILYIWRPSYAQALDLLPHDASCYHIDDEYSFSKTERPLSEQEARLISRVDRVFIHSPALLERKGHLNPHTMFLPNGVDFAQYASQHDEPPDLGRIPKPCIGYVGKIKKHLDFSLLYTLARQNPQWSFVFVGPQMGLGGYGRIVHGLTRRLNVHFLGARPLELLPSYTQHMNVCIMPYELNNYTKHIYPLKLHEYLASGRPVIGSPIRTLTDFSHVLQLANTPKDWEKAIQKALTIAHNTPQQIEARRSVARAFDWNVLVQRLALALCERLGDDHVSRLEQSLGKESSRYRKPEEFS